MKIGFVSTPKGWGGGENLLAQLIFGCRRRGASVTLATPRDSAMAEWADRESIESLQLSGRGRSPAAMWCLRRWFAGERCDVVLLNDPHAITYGGLALAGAGIPRVGVRHTVFPVKSAWKHQRLLECVVAVSNAARDGCLAAGVAADQVRVIHGGLDPLTPDESSVEAARQLFEAEPHGRNLLAIGSLLPVKGFDTLIHAAASQTGEPAWRLGIAGEGPERPRLEALIQGLGVADRVRLLGFRDNIGALLAVSDGLVSASHAEGLSLVLVEAMLAGRPVVSTPVGGAREVLGMTEGDTDSAVACTFEPGDVRGATRAIQRALTPSGETSLRVARASAWARERFSLDRMVDAYLTLFEQLAESAPRGCHAA